MHGWDVVEQMDTPSFVCSAKKAEEVNKALRIVQAKRKASKEASDKKKKFQHNGVFGQQRPFFRPRDNMFVPAQHQNAHGNENAAANASKAPFVPYDTCRLCGKQGHWMKSCPLNKRTNA